MLLLNSVISLKSHTCFILYSCMVQKDSCGLLILHLLGYLYLKKKITVRCFMFTVCRCLHHWVSCQTKLQLPSWCLPHSSWSVVWWLFHIFGLSSQPQLEMSQRSMWQVQSLTQEGYVVLTPCFQARSEACVWASKFLQIVPQEAIQHLVQS